MGDGSCLFREDKEEKRSAKGMSDSHQGGVGVISEFCKCKAVLGIGSLKESKRR